jgi:RHS repeat-associated protein
MKGRMVPAAALIRKLRVAGRSRRNAGFRCWKRPVSASLHRGLAAPSYDFALGIADELVSYTVKKPRKIATRYYAHSNHLYSVAAVTSASGSVVERWSYNAYGVPTIKNSANATIAKSVVGNDRSFTGYRIDSESGLMYARARMYSAKLGRFISEDFKLYNGRCPPKAKNNYRDGFNLFMSYFVPNRLDPSGHGTVIAVQGCDLLPVLGNANRGVAIFDCDVTCIDNGSICNTGVTVTVPRTNGVEAFSRQEIQLLAQGMAHDQPCSCSPPSPEPPPIPDPVPSGDCCKEKSRIPVYVMGAAALVITGYLVTIVCTGGATSVILIPVALAL